MTVYYFTATGNSLYVARAFGGKTVSVPQAIKRGEFSREDDVIGLVFPIFGFGVPRIVQRFISEARFQARYLFAVGTYGSMCGDAMGSLTKLAQRHGIVFDYTDTLKMTDNYLPGFEMNDQLLKLPAKKVEANLAIITENVNIKHKHRQVTGLLAKAASAAIGGVFQGIMNKTAKQFIVNGDCTKCGVCAQACPVHNIVVRDAKPEFGERCEGCLACAHLCPQVAIHMKNEKSAARYRNEAVTAADIIAANRQTKDASE